MAHLSGVETKRTVESIEVVSDDSLRVFRFERTSTGVRISERKAHQSYWDAVTFATLDRKDASLLNTLLGGGAVYSDETFTELTNRNQRHVLPNPEPEVDEAEQARCAELDIERAKAENLREQREIVLLELGRDHANDKHMARDVEGCVACENRIRPGYGDGSLREQDDEFMDPNAGEIEDDI